jgi:hypothetical protein
MAKKYNLSSKYTNEILLEQNKKMLLQLAEMEIKINNLHKNLPKSAEPEFEVSPTSKKFNFFAHIRPHAFKLNARLALMALILSIVGAGAYIYRTTSDQVVASAFETSTSQETNLKINNEFFRNSSQTISNFSNNSMVTEIGSQLIIRQNFISGSDSPNCKTSELPPLANNCYFALVPSLNDLPVNNALLMDFQILGDIPEGSKIVVHQKKYDKAILSKELAVVSNQNKDTKFKIPADFLKSDGLFFQFWERGGKIKIENIVLNYFYTNNFKQVSGTMSDVKAGTEFKIYHDSDHNTLFDPAVDEEWVCKSYFPGAKSFRLTEDRKFEILRDDSCYAGVKLDDWYLDDGKLSLHPSRWILVSSDSQVIKTFYFDYKNEVINLEL